MKKTRKKWEKITKVQVRRRQVPDSETESRTLRRHYTPLSITIHNYMTLYAKPRFKNWEQGAYEPKVGCLGSTGKLTLFQTIFGWFQRSHCDQLGVGEFINEKKRLPEKELDLGIDLR